jgi:hypothetical protein
MNEEKRIELEGFISGIEKFPYIPIPKQIDFISYFLDKSSESGFKPKDIDLCFITLKFKTYSNTATYLSRNLPIEGKPKHFPKFLKDNGSYHLSLQFSKVVEETLGLLKPVVKGNSDLRTLLLAIQDKNENVFLEEAIRCTEVGAYRAAIIMALSLAIDHLQELVLKHHLTAFNLILAANTEKRIKVNYISSKKDFFEIPEGKYIEFLQSAGVISHEVAKYLESKLWLRYTAAQPSNIQISETTAIAFIDELIKTIILKYPL